jgi:hypothetical protein
LLLAWETWWPVIGFFPVTSHTCAMVIHSQNRKNRHYIPISRISSNYPKRGSWTGWSERFLGCRARRNDAECDRAGRSSAFRRKVRPRSGMLAPPCVWKAIAASPALPDPRFAGLLVRRFGAPFHSKKLQRSAVP